MRSILYFCFVPFFTLLYNVDDFFLEDKNRPTVTFIVGQDVEEENRYFAAAKKYYLTHDTADNQALVVDSCRSLWAIQQFLKTFPTKDNKPWGTINIVAHGNEWTGLKLNIVPNVKERVNATTLKRALDKNILPNLTNCRRIDRLTKLQIKGCGVGKDAPLLLAMKQVFGGRLQVSSPEKFVTYQPDNQCYLADFYYSFHHPDSVLNVALAVQELKKRYPSVYLDWKAVLTTENPKDAHSPFVYRCKIDRPMNRDFEAINERTVRVFWIVGC